MADIDRIAFAKPSKVGSDALSRAHVSPDRSRFGMTLRGVRVIRTGETRLGGKACTTMYVAAPRALMKVLMRLDERVVEAAKNNSMAWFEHEMTSDMVEDYHRGLVTVDQKSSGMIARIVVDALGVPVPGASADVELQLRGIVFKRQFFTCVWKLVSVKESSDTDLFQRDADDVVDEEDDEEAAPSAAECEEWRQALMSTLLAREGEALEALETIQDLIRKMDAASPGDLLRTLAEVSDAMQA